MSTMTQIRFFTITDYEQEEEYLSSMCRAGWMIRKFTAPCFYTFEACEPKEMIFRFEFNESPIHLQPDYLAMLQDYGWQYLFTCIGWRVYCKPAEGGDGCELFTDDESKLAMLEKVYRRRLLPLICIFLCCVIPSVTREFTNHSLGMAWGLFWAVMLVIYVYLIAHCSAGLARLRKKYRSE